MFLPNVFTFYGICFDKGYFIIDQQIARYFCTKMNVFSTGGLINPLPTSMILANHDKGLIF